MKVEGQIESRESTLERLRRLGVPFQGGMEGERLILREANLNGVDLSGADLNWANFREADLRKADLSGANLSGASLREANLNGVDLSGADLSGAYLWRADLNGANLSEANLWRADLRKADLSGANLSESSLSGVDLSGANLWRADLRKADLSGADLSGANLSESSLSGVDLSGADLWGADLSGADLRGVDLSNVRHLEEARNLDKALNVGVPWFAPPEGLKLSSRRERFRNLLRGRKRLQGKPGPEDLNLLAANNPLETSIAQLRQIIQTLSLNLYGQQLSEEVELEVASEMVRKLGDEVGDIPAELIAEQLEALARIQGVHTSRERFPHIPQAFHRFLDPRKTIPQFIEVNEGKVTVDILGEEEKMELQLPTLKGRKVRFL